MILLTLLFLQYSSALICSGSEKALFHLPYPSNISTPSLKCFEECIKSDCDGVLLSDNRCFVLYNSSFTLEFSTFAPKKCVLGLTHNSIAQSASQLVVPDWEASIISTQSHDDCIVRCANEKHCSACQYFTDSLDCLVSQFESREGPDPLPDIDGFNVTYTRVISPIPKGECSPSFDSFRSVPFSTPIYGDAQLYNGSTGIQQCISHCSNCSAILYSSHFKECFIITPSTVSQPLNFIDNHFMILSSLCSPPSLPCNPISSIYTARTTDSLNERITCLTNCIDDPFCRYAYSISDDECLTSSYPLQLAPTITRYCTNHDNNEFDGAAVLYEESRFCGRGNAINVTGIGMLECMQLCITHPTKSCDAVSYEESIQTCSVFEGGKVERVEGNCSFLALNMITFDTDKEFIQKLGDKITDELLARKEKWRTGKKGESRKKNPKARGLKLKRKKNISRLIEDEKEIEVKTICNMDVIKVIVVSSQDSEIGEIFVKDRSSLCNSTQSNSSERTLEIRLNDWEKCGLNKKDFVYSFTVVVKRDFTSGIVTKRDGMYRVTCDYSNAHTTTVSSILRMGENSYNKMPMNGKITVGNELKMELRSTKDGKTKKVQIGQPLQLVFSASNDGNYNVNSCTAMNEKKTESVEIIESGCPSTGLSLDIVRGPISRTKNGFTLPLRAFKFREGEGVEIACEVEPCEGQCKSINCSSSMIRTKRQMKEINSNSTLVTIQFKVTEDDLSSTLICISQWHILLSFSIIVSTFVILLFFFFILSKWRKSKRRI